MFPTAPGVVAYGVGCNKFNRLDFGVEVSNFTQQSKFDNC